MNRKLQRGLKWIIEILNKNKITFRITGGLAANIHGSGRPVKDIDIRIPENSFEEVVRDAKDYIIRKPKRRKNKIFDEIYMTLNYKGQEIDISGNDTAKIFDKKKNKWLNDSADFSKNVKKKFFGITIPIAPKEDVIFYKKIINKGVHKKDVENMKKN